ncbi:MAG: YigZ family protein [Clostridia bacterium]|nr:YigZ family protein [Clostridia bacterium]
MATTDTRPAARGPASYRTLKAFGSEEFIINKSRFIGYASPVGSEQEALDFIASIRVRHRDATHNCYAYTLGTNMGVMRYSDDGEPSGTAGLPMMEVIKKETVCNCCCVVTRYFGGVLLGAGGLLRAYTQGCASGLRAAGIVTMEDTARYLCEVPYGLWDKVQYVCRSLPVMLQDTAYATAVTFTLLTRVRDADTVLAALTSQTDGVFLYLPDGSSFAAWETEDAV